MALVLATVSIWWWPGFSLPALTGSTPHTLYYLSAVAQSLAAVLALVFTISLVVAQLTSRYSHRMLAGFFDWVTIVYILVFLAAVFVPLWLFALEHPPPWATRVSLTLAAAALLWLVPYFLRFRNRLDPEWVVAGLGARARRQLKADQQTEPKEVGTIDNFCMSAFTFKDYDTLQAAAATLAVIGLQAADDYRASGAKAVFYRLKDIGLATIEDPVAPMRVMGALAYAATKAVEQEKEAALGWAVFPLSNIGAAAVDKGLENQVLQAITYLKSVGVEAAQHGLGELCRVTEGLSVIAVRGSFCEWSHLDRVTCEAITAMGQLVVDGIEHRMEEVSVNSMVSQLALVGRAVAARQKSAALHELGYRLWVIGAHASSLAAGGTGEQVITTLDSLVKGGLPSGYFQPDYLRARGDLPPGPLRQGLADFRQFFDCPRDHKE